MRTSPACVAAVALALVAGAAPRARAESPSTMPLVDLEVRAGMGLEMGGASTSTVLRPSPMTVGARAAFAIQDEPAMWAYVGGMTETGGRASSGLLAGVQLAPRGKLRLSAGGLWIAHPYSLYGAVASAGICGKASGAVHLCGDLEATLLFAGSDLPMSKAITEWQLVLGVRFDAM